MAEDPSSGRSLAKIIEFLAGSVLGAVIGVYLEHIAPVWLVAFGVGAFFLFLIAFLFPQSRNALILGLLGVSAGLVVVFTIQSGFWQPPVSTATSTARPTIPPSVPPTRTAFPPSAMPDSASIECILYDSNNLQIVNLGTSGWKLIDGSEQVALLDNESDANQALELGKRYTKTCFIGNRETTYRTQYWEEPSGLSSNLIDRDCIPYNPNNVEVVSNNNLWSIVESGSMYMEALTSRLDAEAVLQIVKQNNQQCFIGRDNKRSNRMDYIVEYWK